MLKSEPLLLKNKPYSEMVAGLLAREQRITVELAREIVARDGTSSVMENIRWRRLHKE